MESRGNVVIYSADANNLQCVKLYRQLTGCSLNDAKQALRSASDSHPLVIPNVSDAIFTGAEFEKFGAKVFCDSGEARSLMSEDAESNSNLIDKPLNVDAFAPRYPNTDAPSDKQRLIAEMERLYQYFNQKGNAYHTLVKAHRDVAALRKPNLIKWIFGGGLLAVIIYFALVLIGIDMMAGFFVLWIIITGCGYTLKNKKYKKDIDFFSGMTKRCEQEVIAHYNNAANCFIAYEYSSPDVISELVALLKNGRANTYADALNLYISDCNSAELIKQQQALQRQMNQQARTQAANTLLVATMLASKKRR